MKDPAKNNETGPEEVKDDGPKIFDVIVAGGGIAGAVAAYHVARHGLNVALFEKEIGPHHKVCGEFISGEAVPILEEIGIDLKKLGGVVIRKFRLHGPYQSFETRLPTPAIGLSRYVLDEALLEQASAAGARVFRGTFVREKLESLDSPLGSIVIETSAGQARAQRLVVATGKHEFRSVHSRRGKDSGMVGLKMHLRLKPSAAKKAKDSCDLFIFEKGYGGLAPIENGLFNFCFLIEKKMLKEIGADWDAMSSYIGRHNWQASYYLDGAEPQFKSFVTVANIPYGFVRSDSPEPGVFCVGDQIAVIPSLTGNGMSIAASTGRAAAASILNPSQRSMMLPASSAKIYQKEVTRKLRPQVAFGYQLHRVFKSPRLCDWLARAGMLAPQIADLFFHQTRCRIESGSAVEMLPSGARDSVASQSVKPDGGSGKVSVSDDASGPVPGSVSGPVSGPQIAGS